MERLPPFYAGLPERRHGPPLPSTAVLTPQNQGRDSFYNTGSRSEEKSSVAFPFPRQHGYPIPERGLARGDWRPASPAETCLQSGGDRKAPGGPAATMGRVEPVEEPSRQQQWDQGHRDHLRNYPPHPQGHKHLQCPPQPWVRAHPPHPQGQQHRDHPPHPQGQQHRDLPPGHQHLDHMPHSQGHERAPHPWDHEHQGQPPHLQDYPPLPQGHEQKEYLPHLQAYECRDQASLPQGFSHQDRSAHQYQEHYPQQGQPYRCPQPPYQHKHLDSQQQYPFREHLHPPQSAPFSERAGVANNVPPHIHSVPSHSENSSCQNHTLLPGGILNLPAGYGPQSSQLINHSHNIHSNQQNFPNSSGEISPWRNEHRMQSNNEKMEILWPNVPDFSQSLKDVSVEQLHRNDSMTRRPSPDQFSQSFKCNEPLKEQDELWLMRFLSKRRLQSCKIKKPKSFLLVSEVKESVLSACKLVTELTALCQQLRHNVENEAVWSESYLKAIEIKTALQVKLKTLSDGDYLNAVKKKLERIKKKRSSIQRKKQEWRLEKQEEAERAAEKEAKIDEWRMKRVREVEDKKRERELKAAADSVLSEVRKKQADAKRLVDILRAIEKLRKLRKEAAARKGVQPPPSADDTFEHHVERLRKLIKKRSDLYDAEERALRVMLEGEQEEERKRENEKKLKKEREKLEKQQREVESMMFGDPELPADHPLQPFRQYYLQAEHSSHVLVQIRQEWDRYLVPGDHPDGSSIPQGWVFPHPPSSDTWATALKQNES